MRIIAGKYKNRRIDTPSGMITRPLLSRVRKSVMDILQPYLPEARVLDLFTGTGILAFESLSRGAAFALCIEANRAAFQLIQHNRERICPKDPMRVIQGDVIRCLPVLTRQESPFDVIGITPPYGKSLEYKTLETLAECPALMHPDTVIFVQHFHKDDLRLDWPHLEHVRTRRYGKTVVEFFMPRTS